VRDGEYAQRVNEAILREIEAGGDQGPELTWLGATINRIEGVGWIKGADGPVRGPGWVDPMRFFQARPDGTINDGMVDLVVARGHELAVITDARLAAADQLGAIGREFSASVLLDELQAQPLPSEDKRTALLRAEYRLRPPEPSDYLRTEPAPLLPDCEIVSQLRRYRMTDADVRTCYDARDPASRAVAIAKMCDAVGARRLF